MDIKFLDNLAVTPHAGRLDIQSPVASTTYLELSSSPVFVSTTPVDEHPVHPVHSVPPHL